MQTMQTMQKVTPLIFGVIYIAFPVGVTVYFIVSSFCRIVIQEILFRTGVTAPRPAGEAGARTVSAPRRRGFMDKLADMQAQAQEARRRQQGLGPSIEASSQDSESTGSTASPSGGGAKPAGGAAKRPPRPRPPVGSGSQNNNPRPVKAKQSGGSAALSDQGGDKEASKTNGSAGGQNGRPPSGNGRPQRASGRNGARTNGTAGQGNGEAEDLKQKQTPPRSKDKRPRKAR
jgi:hypothetical protein